MLARWFRWRTARSLLVLAVIALVLSPGTALGQQDAPAYQAAALDFPVPHGHFFKQANGEGGAGSMGFAVVDDDAPFWSAFQRLGGVEALGYPISRRFAWDGFLVQAFQKAALQWRPEVGQFYFVNLFDRMSAAGKDAWLEGVRSTPPSFDHSPDGGLAWPEVVARHQGFLDVNPAIKARYFADPDPIQHFGLPMAYADYGNVFVVRAQRAVFQQWRVDVPWAKAGQVVIANGGDVAKEAGIYPLAATAPHAPEHSRTLSVLAGPERIYLLQTRWAPPQTTGSPGPVRARLLSSDDLGNIWQPFAGGLPVASDCVGSAGMDYATRDTLYLSTCDGIYRWGGAGWEHLTSQGSGTVAVTYGDPTRLFSMQGGKVVRSNDGGRTWSDLGAREEAASVGVDTRNAKNVYVLGIGGGRPNVIGGWAFTLWRGTGEQGQWTQLPGPYRPAVSIKASMTIDGATGDIYLMARSLNSEVYQLWRTTNADAADASTVRWELVHEFDRGLDVQLYASGATPAGLALYATAGYRAGAGLPGSWFGDAGDDPVLIRSLDGGRTWGVLEAS